MLATAHAREHKLGLSCRMPWLNHCPQHNLGHTAPRYAGYVWVKSFKELLFAVFTHTHKQNVYLCSYLYQCRKMKLRCLLSNTVHLQKKSKGFFEQ